MAQSQVSGMKMRNLLFGVILGLLAVVHSTPVDSVIQNPTKTEDDIVGEVQEDGYLIDYTYLPSLTTESPKRNTTIQASQQPSSHSKENDMFEGSATGATLVSSESTTSVFPQHGGEHHATTTLSDSYTQSSTSTVLPRDADESRSDSSTTQSPQSSFTSSPVPNEGQPNVVPDHILVSQTTTGHETSDEPTTSVFLQHGGEHYATTTLSDLHGQRSTSTVLPKDTDESSSDSSTTQSPQSSFTSSLVLNEGQPNVTPDHIKVSQTTDPAVSTIDYLSSDSGHREMLGEYPATSSSMTSSSNTQTSIASSTSTAAFIGRSERSESGSELGSGIEDIAEKATKKILFFQPHNDGSWNEAETPAPHHNTASSSMTSSSITQTSIASSTSTAAFIGGSEGSRSGSELGSGIEDIAEKATKKILFFQPHNDETPAPHPNTASSSMMSSSITQTSTASSTSTAAFIGGSEGSRSGSELGSGIEDIAEKATKKILLFQPHNDGKLTEAENPESHKGHGTPGWIIILGFIVGVAALVMLCLAIATRDKWNGPNQSSQLETKTNFSNQQRELEMETFLHKDSPRENGKAAEYTVIPLDELPEKYSSH